MDMEYLIKHFIAKFRYKIAFHCSKIWSTDEYYDSHQSHTFIKTISLNADTEWKRENKKNKKTPTYAYTHASQSYTIWNMSLIETVLEFIRYLVEGILNWGLRSDSGKIFFGKEAEAQKLTRIGWRQQNRAEHSNLYNDWYNTLWSWCGKNGAIGKRLFG